jgi:hypothetical protein
MTNSLHVFLLSVPKSLKLDQECGIITHMNAKYLIIAEMWLTVSLERKL